MYQNLLNGTTKISRCRYTQTPLRARKSCMRTRVYVSVRMRVSRSAYETVNHRERDERTQRIIR